MKTMNFEQMEQTQAQGWFGCALGIAGLAVASGMAMAATGPIGGWAMLSFLTTTAGMADSCVDAIMY